jgi:hypothetical protein
MKHPDNAELAENLRMLNEHLTTLTELQAMPQTDMVLHRTILAARIAGAALDNVLAWRDAQLLCARLETVH